MQRGKEVDVKKGQSPQPSRISPEGLRVLVVDDDPTCLRVVKAKLVSCKYEVTTCQHAKVALSILRERKEKFDLILTDVHMPDIDGFKLLELVGVELDLPVINRDVKVATKGLERGACYYLMKPLCFNELKNIWQHVVRWKKSERKESDQGGSVEDSEHKKATVEDDECDSSIDASNYGQPKRKKEDEEGKNEDEEQENEDSAHKKPRMVWSTELHGQFLKAIDELGFDKAVPKKILELMNVPGLTRENVASHLQKYRLYIRRLTGTDKSFPSSSSSFSSGSIGPNLASGVKEQVSPSKLSDQCNLMMPRSQWAGHMQSFSSPMFMPSIDPMQSHLQQLMEGNSVGYGMPSNQMRANQPPLCNEPRQWTHQQQQAQSGLFGSSGQGNTLNMPTTGGHSNLSSIGNVGSFGGPKSTQAGNYTGLRMTSTGGLHGLTLSGSSAEPSNIVNSRNNQMVHEISHGKAVTEANTRDFSNPYFNTLNCGYSNQGASSSCMLENTNRIPGRFSDPTQQQTDFQKGMDGDGLLSDLLQCLPFDEENPQHPA